MNLNHNRPTPFSRLRIIVTVKTETRNKKEIIGQRPRLEL